MARDLFFYGTLRHLPLLEIVLGRAAARIDQTPARLSDHAVSGVAEGPFPMIAPQTGAQADGLLVQGLSAQDIDRLDFYEGSFAYDLVLVTLQGGQEAEVYLPQPGLWTPAGPWSLKDWAEVHGAMSCHAAREVMGYFGRKTRDEVAAIFPRIRMRAMAQVRAATSRHGQRTYRGNVQMGARARVYGDFYALDEFDLRHQHFDGTMSERMSRAAFIASDSVIVLPYDPVRDRVLMVEQIRMGPLARGDRTVWQLEPIAGMIDLGETPDQTARREAQEEAGLTLIALEPIAELYPSPGNATEFHYVYLGLADLPDGAQGIGGLDAEHEDIRSHLMSFDELMAYVDDFQVANAPMMLAALWLARHRDRLRSGQGAATP